MKFYRERKMNKKKNFKEISAKLDSIIPSGVRVENKNREKFANAMTKKAGLSYDTAYEMSRVPLNYQDPLYDSILVQFQGYSLEEKNRRFRHYYKYNPILSNCVDIHSTFPLSDFELQAEDEEIKNYYNFLSRDKYNLLAMAEYILRDKTLLGEAFYIGNWDEENLEWKDWVQYPPEYIDITTIPGSSEKVFTVKPDPEIKKINQENTEASKILEDILRTNNRRYYEAAMKEQNYDVAEDRLIYVANKTNGYTKRGYALTERAVQDLLYESQIRTLQHTFVQRHLFPIKVFKLGSKELGWIPSKKHFENFKKLLIQAASDPDFNLIYHFGLEVEYIGTKDKIENLIPHFDWCAKRIMNAFFCNDTLINGETPGYAGQTANMKMLMMRFNTAREDLQKEFRNKIFFRIAKMQGFVKQTDGEIKKAVKVKSKNFSYKKYILPEFLWRRQNLLNNTQEQQFIMNLYQNDDIPFSIVADMFNLDTDMVKAYRKKDQGTYSNKITREIIDQTVKESPELSLKYVMGEDPIEIMKQKLSADKEVEKQEAMEKEMDMNGQSDFAGGGDIGSFDSGAPLDLGSDDVSSDTSTEEAPIEEGPTEGEGSETLPDSGGEPSPLE